MTTLTPDPEDRLIHEIRRLLGDPDSMTLRQVGGWVEITTAYLDRHNDHLQVYAERTGTGFSLTDDGGTVADLETNGLPPDQNSVRWILEKYGVRMDGKALTVQAETDYFSLRIRNLVRAMLEVERAAAGIETTLTCGPTSGDHQ